MRELTFVGLSDDGRSLVLSGADGQRYTVPIDQRLTVAARLDRSRLGQLEIEMDGGLRPKDIQARIRAGMSVEEVAAASGLPVEKVDRFGSAVIAERAYVAERAAATAVRTPAGSGPLGEVVADRLGSRGIDPATMRWDAWRREDGRWVVMLGYGAGGGEEQSATWLFDAAARSVVPGDDEARWLLEDRPTVIVAAPDAPPSAGADEGPADVAPPTGVPHLVPVPDVVDDEDDLAADDSGADDDPGPSAAHPAHAGVEHADDEAGAEAEAEPAPRPAKPRPNPPSSRGKRPAVPSWDEILFGAPKKTD